MSPLAAAIILSAVQASSDDCGNAPVIMNTVGDESELALIPEFPVVVDGCDVSTIDHWVRLECQDGSYALPAGADCEFICPGFDHAEGGSETQEAPVLNELPVPEPPCDRHTTYAACQKKGYKDGCVWDSNLMYCKRGPCASIPNRAACVHKAENLGCVWQLSTKKCLPLDAFGLEN